MIKYVAIALVYALAGYGAWKLFSMVITGYLTKMSDLGNEAVRKYYERLHYIKLKTENVFVTVPVCITAAALSMILWPITIIVTVIWNSVDYHITKKEYTTNG